MAEENKQMLDPIAYRSDFNPNDIQQEYKDDPNLPGVGPLNANLNYKQYGDDSSPEWQGQKGGMNPKYEGEGVSNTYIEYNPDLTVADLDPNYLYGENARQQNRQEAGYIARRNDNIASALYNEGLTSYEDVEKFLSQQKDWTNSTNEDRLNTIKSVWKRLGQIKPKEEPEEEHKAPIDENALMEDGTGKLFGKTTADTGEPIEGIDTKADANSILNSMNQARVRNVNALRAMKPTNAATSTYFGTTPYGEQAMRDIQTMDPEWYAQYQEELRKLYIQDKADTISHGAADEESKDIITSTDETIENDKRDWVDKNSDKRNNLQVESILEKELQSNQVATSAKEEMLNIKKDIADLNSELDDLPNKAEKAFKGDVPDYIYKAFISNNSQMLQKKIQNLENRYASLADIYKTEVSNTQWELEYKLKQEQLGMDRTKMNFDMAYKTAQLELDSIHWDNGKAFKVVDGKIIQISDGTAYANYTEKVNAGLGNMEQMAENNALYGSCESFTDDIAENTAGVRMVGPGNKPETTVEQKVWYATQFGLFSDYIPEVGDVAVFDYRDAPANSSISADSRVWGHTMYVAGYDEATGMIHLIGSNGPGDLANRVYSKDISLDEFYKNYGAGFWNPYKYAQWKSMQGKQENQYSPMQPVIDRLLNEYKESGKTNMFSELGKFQELYTNLYQADKDGTLSAMIDSGVIGTFLTNVAFNWAQNQGGDLALGDDKGVKNFLKLAGDEMLLEAESYVAKNGGFKDDPQAQKAYDGFRKMVRAIQIKLRDESGAAINKSERATDFLLFLPKASDSKALKESKLRDMEEYLRRMGTDAGIDSSEYIPLNLGKTKQRSTD